MNRFVIGKTKIQTLKGIKNIKDVKIGDSVYSYKEGEIILSLVKEVYKIKVQYTDLIKIDTNKSRIICTKKMQLFVDRAGWKAAENIQPSDFLKDKNGIDKVSLTKIDYARRTKVDVFTIETEEGNYYANNLLVRL